MEDSPSDRSHIPSASNLADPSDQEALELERARTNPLTRIPTVSSTSEQRYGPAGRRLFESGGGISHWLFHTLNAGTI